jgi:hypothetical protein
MFSNRKPEPNVNGSWRNKYLYIYHTCNSILLNIYTAAWYTGDLKELVDEALVTGNDLPTSDAYTINGEPGDFCPCSNSMSLAFDFGSKHLQQ